MGYQYGFDRNYDYLSVVSCSKLCRNLKDPKITLRVMKFVVRRIAEYPKGPVIALSILFGSLAAFLKVLT
jgi:hypothetical protein